MSFNGLGTFRQGQWQQFRRFVMPWLEKEAALVLTLHDERGEVPGRICLQASDEQGRVVLEYETRAAWFSRPQEEREVPVHGLSPGRY